MKILFSFLLIPLFFLGGPVTASAQDKDEQSPAASRLDELRRVKLIEFLDVGEEQAVRYLAREKEYRNVEREMFRRRKGAIEQLNTALTGGEKSEAEIRKMINEISDIDQKILATKWDFIHNQGDILTPAQVGKLVVFEQRFREEIRKAFKDLPRSRRNRH